MKACNQEEQVGKLLRPILVFHHVGPMNNAQTMFNYLAFGGAMYKMLPFVGL